MQTLCRLLACGGLSARLLLSQPAPFSIERVLSAPFPSELTAAPAGGKVAWISNRRGVYNVMVAEPPKYEARQITAYQADEGKDLSDLRWTADAQAVVYVRGNDANPTSNPKGPSQEIWMAPLSGGPPRSLGEGSSPAVAPKQDRIAYLRQGQIHLTSGTSIHARGQCSKPVWSPDGTRLAFVASRGDHALIGVYDVAGDALRYVDASTDMDSEPEWSPDGASVAFLREPSNGLRPIREARREGEPWSIRVADAATGAGREIWRAHTGPGSVFRGVSARSQLLWSSDGRIVFPWEGDGWTHLYSVPAGGGQATPLTPGAFEVEDVTLAGREVVYSSNQGDIDRRHLWRVPVAGGKPVAITTGSAIEVEPAMLSSGEVAFLHSDAARPLRPAMAGRDLEPLPANFPVEQMVVPQQVVFSSADGLGLHGQLFLPPKPAAGGKSSAVVFFHGGSRRQMLLGWHYMYYYSNAYALNQYLANSGYIVLSVNYRSGIGYGLDFREAVNYGASGGTEYNDVQGAGVYLRSRPDVDPARIGAWGGSYGGYLVAMALARASDLFRAGVDFHGVHNWATELKIPVTAPDYQVAFESSPMAFLKTWHSPVLLIQGDDDRDVQFNQTVMLADALRRQGVEMEELILPDEIHDFLLWRSWVRTYQATVEFLGRHLK